MITNEDNLKMMSRYEDGFFDLAIVDPPYGINASQPSKKSKKVKQKNGDYLSVNNRVHQHKNWDDKPPEKVYFDELFRVSKNQIIFGVNYFDYKFSPGRIIWDKLNGESDQFDCEIAFNSCNNRTDIVRYMWYGMLQGLSVSRLVKKANFQQGNKSKNEKKIHPTQKPVKLYEWLLFNYAKKGDKILDTHLGSGSIAIACHNLNFDLTACELDKDYYKESVKRINEYKSQTRLF